MGQSITIGGDRLGSGNKNKQFLDNYHSSNFNLSQKFTSSMQVGTLYPFLCIPGMRGDKFTINLDADARTIPTKGPLFGSFKMQVDLFQCDVRLYQALLHNNPLAIGLNMSRVKFPVMRIKDNGTPNAMANSCLMKYLGLSGIGGGSGSAHETYRDINAIPMLAYYEIFKTYYANKQEENAYMIGTELLTGDYNEWLVNYKTITGMTGELNVNGDIEHNSPNLPLRISINTYSEPDNKTFEDNIYVIFVNEDEEEIAKFTIKEGLKNGWIARNTTTDKSYLIKLSAIETLENPLELYGIKFGTDERNYISEIRGLQPFNLSNIDEMRMQLLSDHRLGFAFKITNADEAATGEWNKSNAEDYGLPYTALVDLDDNGDTLNKYPLQGLVVKTYQSDIFNNWINTEWIDGENGIAEITAIDTSNGSIKIDSINLAEKLYNMLNRIAMSDGSYEGWQDSVYTDTPRRHIESPIYLGGMSNEIMFEEIVQTSQGDNDNPLGTLAGKGKLFKRKGGQVTVKCNEACFIIGIVSLTPRVNYCQGNEFYLTDLKSMDDFHKPALDAIGFQNLIGERMAYFDTHIYPDHSVRRHTIGKIPAWMEYMTAVDKCYGDFAETEGRGFMTLLRDYSKNPNSSSIKDATTYIDPRKYNYAFAVSDIEAQNFWVQIYSQIEARRLMSAKQIPNL